MRPRLLLVVGARGPGLTETLAAASRRADVVVAGLSEVLLARRDAAALDGQRTVEAPTADDLVERIAALCRRTPFQGAMTLADDAVVLTARVAAAAGVRGLDPARVHVFRDKAAQRQMLAAAGVTVPRWSVGGDDRIRLPVIIKPTGGSGGALAFVVTEEHQLAPVLAECRERVAGTPAVDIDTAFIVEEIIEPTRWHDVEGFAAYVSVESAALDGRRWHLAVTDRFPLDPPVLETGMCLPSSLTEEQQAEVVAVTDHALDAVGLDQGLSHTELMLTSEGPVVIEVNARAGGALPYLFPLAGGPDLTALAVDLALGTAPGPVSFDAHALFVALQHPLGVDVDTVGDLDAIRALPGVHAVVPLHGPGHSTRSLQDTMAALVLARVPDPEDAVHLHGACRDAFVCRYSGGPTPEHYRRTPDGVVHPG